MPVSLSASQLADVVSALRAAGCVFAEEEAQILAAAASTPDELAAMVGRRSGGLPLEQVVGWAEFCGLRITVAPGVFVPRRRSEFLVRLAVSLPQPDAPVLVDLCCGTGAVGVALSAAIGGAELHAADIDPDAVACARQNVGRAGHVYLGDLYDPLPASLRGRVTTLIANAPYVPTGELGLMPAEARLHEPRVALDGGQDGVEIHRRIAAAAPDWLAPGGHLLIETSERQAPLTEGAVTLAGLASRVVICDDWSTAAVVGSWPG
jgi:release factor glutamine methyltransferase